VLGALAGGAHEALQRLGVSNAGWLFDRVASAAVALARQQDKALRVTRHGDEVEIDRSTAERLVEPLHQLVRNAVTHGVEPPASRLSRGQSARATLRLTAMIAGDRVRLAVEDDGAGVDLSAASRRARALGALREVDAGDPRAVLASLFAPGVSTRSKADAAAGRGVGLDLVRREVGQLGGVVSAASERGHFARFEIEVAARPPAQRVLIVRVSRESFALPLERVVRVQDSADTEPQTPVLSLAAAVGLEPLVEPGDKTATTHVVVRTTPGLLALVVDEVERARELAVRPLPWLLSGTGPWAAATLDGEGLVTLVPDLDRLAVKVL
jgi:two-component system chemotaxis sensor kinase CheA